MMIFVATAQSVSKSSRPPRCIHEFGASKVNVSSMYFVKAVGYRNELLPQSRHPIAAS